MTAPTRKQIEEYDKFDYPKTPVAIVGYGLAKFGAMAVLIGVLIGMVMVQYYHDQTRRDRMESVLVSNAKILAELTGSVIEDSRTNKDDHDKVKTILGRIEAVLNRN